MNDLSEQLSCLKPSSAFSIVCGIIKTNTRIFTNWEKTSLVSPWQTHVFEDNCRNLSLNEVSESHNRICIKDLESIFYPALIQCLFPNGTTLSPLFSEVKSFTSLIKQKVVFNNYPLSIEYIDFFIFPGNHVIYCLKFDFSDVSVNELIKLIGKIREMALTELVSLVPVLQKIIINGFTFIGNKHHLFTGIGFDSSLPEEYTADHLLYDLGTCSPVGSAVGLGETPLLKPSYSYFNQLIGDARISVFDNWSALCLYDTFTLIHRGKIYHYNWEFRYFRVLYIHSLFVKAYLADLNHKFYLENREKDLEFHFHEFNKHFNLKEISYTFLPQIIYEKIRYGLNIDRELTNIYQSIEQDHKKKLEKRNLEESAKNNKINIALFIVAILAVFSAIKDGSDWLSSVFLGERGLIFNVVTVLSFFLIYLLVIFFLIRRK